MASFKYNASLFSVSDDDVAPAQNVGIESLLSIMHLETEGGECLRENSMSNDIRRERHLDILNAAAIVLAKANKQMSSSTKNISKRKGSTQIEDIAD